MYKCNERSITEHTENGQTTHKATDISMLGGRQAWAGVGGGALLCVNICETTEVLGMAGRRAALKLNDDSNEWGCNDLCLQRLFLIETWGTRDKEAGAYHTHTHTHTHTHRIKQEHMVSMCVCVLMLCIGNRKQSRKLLHTHRSLLFYFLLSGLYTVSKFAWC